MIQDKTQQETKTETYYGISIRSHLNENFYSEQNLSYEQARISQKNTDRYCLWCFLEKLALVFVSLIFSKIYRNVENGMWEFG